MTLAPPDVTAVRSHLVQGLGPPADVLELSGSPDNKLSKLEVAMWTPAGATGPAVLISCGMSRLALADGRRFEGVLIARPVPPKDDLTQLVKLLGRFGLFVSAGTHPVVPGTVIRAAEELAAVSSMSALVVMPALTFPPQFRQFKRGEKGVVDLVWLVPIHESEAKIAEAHGGEALMMQFTAYGTDLSQWRRDAVPKMLTVAEAKAMVASHAPPPPATPPSDATRQERVAALKREALARAESSSAHATPPTATPTTTPPAAGAPRPRASKPPTKK